MTIKNRLLLVICSPIVIFAFISLFIGLAQYSTSLYEKTEAHLKSTALAALTMYSGRGYGDYNEKPDGNIWRGMNFNVSEHTSIVDELKAQTHADITFFYGDMAAMTSLIDEESIRRIGMPANEKIKEYTLKQGMQLWFPEMKIGDKVSQAYVIPVRQPSNNEVIGALMASQSADGFNATIGNFIVTNVMAVIIILLASFFFIRRRVDWFSQKFSEISDKSKQDLLTGLLNKLSFEETVKAAIDNRKRGDVSVLMILDFDNFKQVNDTYGHQVGDEVLKGFSNILNRAFRTKDLIGRVGGDEFMVFMPGMKVENLKRTDEIAEEILNGLYNMKVGDAEHFSCSIGIATDALDHDFRFLYMLADDALYESKERGKACYVRYSSDYKK